MRAGLGLCGVVAAVAVTLILAHPVTASPAQPTLPQRYLAVYLKINDAEHLEKKGDYRGALSDFRDCYSKLTQIRELEPRWESALVGRRLDDCRAKIVELELKAPEQAASKSSTSVPVALPHLKTPDQPANEKGGTVPPHFELTLAAGNRAKNTFQWRTDISATLFWIGEGSNNTSAWNEKWKAKNNGDDSPRDRNGYASGTHASLLNPFYVALPFNDVAFPKKAQKWLPPGWAQPAKNGTAVSACKDRWVMIKNKNGDICYAQWEDAGPGRKDQAEYVFGDERPSGAGIDLSPAVGEYLGLGPGNNTVSWRFVDDDDVRPGAWLKLNEQAVIFTALHESAK